MVSATSRRISLITLLLVTLATPTFAAPRILHTGPVSAVRQLPNGLQFRSGDALVRITVVAPAIWRLRYTTQADFPPDHSFAVIPQAESRDAKVKATQSATALTVTDGNVAITVNRSSGVVTFADAKGTPILADQPDHPVTWDDKGFRIYKTMTPLEAFYGLGDKADSVNHRGYAYTNWNTDAVDWQRGSDPLYKTIPFFIGMTDNLTAFGVFLDNTYRTSFDFGKESNSYFSFGSTGGDLNYYFIAGPTPKEVVERYTSLTGRTPLPPLYALGYQQSRYSYYPEARVRQIADEFRSRKIPCDVLYLDIDYQQDYKAFTINRDRFPHFEQMVKDLGDQGFKLVLISDLHLKKEVGYKPYDQGTAHGYFVKNPDGSQYVGRVWPGPSVFPDFTLAPVRKWYGSLYKMFTDMGVAGFWNDMNEPSVFRHPDRTMPLDTVHRVDSETENRNPSGPIRSTDHREIHNAFGMENVRATHDGLLALRPDERPFVLTRAAYAGTQRYAATWTGDNASTWVHYRLTVPTLLGMSVSGFPLVGADVGGFAFSPTPDLLTRWIELGAFQPIDRDHTTWGSLDQEPWVHGPEHEAIRRRYIETRYRLLPYIYTSMEETSRTGIPLMRPMFLENPLIGMMEGINDDQYFFGPDLLVAPKLLEALDSYDVTLPAGTWYDYWTGHKVEATEQPAWDETIVEGAPKPPMVERLKLNPKLDELPVYVRGGSIIPHQPLVQSSSEKPQGPLQLAVYPGPNCSGSVYTDDGHTLDYQRGHYFRQSFSCDATPQAVTVKLAAPQGDFTPWWTQLRITVYGQREPISRDLPVSRDAQTVTINY
ncbi:MAG TPA: glycoside hydrolase family 31 protein [Terriglobales bacterium]|nr:glycoside hydrolase family 31 protein [Terriglobales bacterium]